MDEESLVSASVPPHTGVTNEIPEIIDTKNSGEMKLSNPETSDSVHEAGTTEHTIDEKEDNGLTNVVESEGNDVEQELTECEQHEQGKTSVGNSGSRGDTAMEEDACNTRASTSKEQSSDNVDPYAYVKREGFTSEIFKIEIQNLPKRYGISQLKKRLTSQKVNPIKIKTPTNGNYVFITFRCEEERENALKVLDGHVWKGKTLKVKRANPAADPLLKRKQEEADNQRSDKRMKVDEDDGLSIDDRLKNAVTPLWKVPYAEQLKTKHQTITEFMKRLSKEVERNNQELRQWLTEQRKKFDGSCCDILPIKSSPVLEGYRNKCEFTIGHNQEGKERVVGFRFGSYRDGVYVAEPHNIDALLGDPMKRVVKEVQQCLSDSKWGSFNAVDHSGHWTMLTVRTTQAGEVMAILAFNNQHELTQSELEETKQSVVQYFTSGPGKDSGVSSLYFLPRDEGQRDLAYEHLFGSKSITEDLLGFKFRISPDAFFQVNTCAAEVLYSTISDWCCVTPDTTVLDVCCGTGTIGITMAKKAKRIVGIEMVQQATDDARANAKLNGVENTEYYCGKAEDVLPGLMYRFGGSDVIAVVDPPRSGLHYKVIQAIRRAEYLKRLVYVSCNPNGALQNLVDLMRSKSNRIKGRPFLPVKAVAVDLFPHTKHCELVLLFERQDQTTAQ